MLDPAELGGRVREKRRAGGLSLRRASDEAQVSFTTLSRVEAGHVPDLTTYKKLVRWLGLAETAAEPDQGTTIQVIAGHLQRDPALAPEDAERISRVVGELYMTRSRAERSRLTFIFGRPRPSAPRSPACLALSSPTCAGR